MRTVRALMLLALIASLIGAEMSAAHADRDVPSRFARAAVPGGDTFVYGQRYAGDLPDPAIVRTPTRWFAYGTNTGNVNLPVLTSSGLKTWSVSGHGGQPEAFPNPPAWAVTQKSNGATVWAPSVHRYRGRFVMFYSARVVGSTRLCIGKATSARPWGPFIDTSTRPFLCPGVAGAIDPFLFVHKKRPYLLLKTDDNAHYRTTRLWSKRLTKGLSPDRSPYKRLLKAESGWERGLIENPAMIRRNGRFYLFYSAHVWNTAAYATGYAICTKPQGPCKRVRKKPLLKTNAARSGPGGAFPFTFRGGGLLLAYHAWRPGQEGYALSSSCAQTVRGCGQRRMFIAKLRVDRKGKLHLRDGNIAR